MEKPISRRHFLFLSSLLALSYPYRQPLAAALQEQIDQKVTFPLTVGVLKEACSSEMKASRHYIGFSQKAIEENYPNIAYIFLAFSKSEKIHAENYGRILASMGSRPDESLSGTLVEETRTNLHNAAQNELIKINESYPRYLESLKPEMHDEAVINCMYAWKSHQQHEEMIEEIQKYSKHFFGSVAEELEGLNMDLHVCRICGATIDEAPEIACNICNYPINHYLKIDPPLSS
jgi:rubrerythrin